MNFAFAQFRIVNETNSRNVNRAGTCDSPPQRNLLAGRNDIRC